MGKIIHAISLDALEQSINFINRLINEEAKDEDCELVGQSRITSYAVLENIFKNIDSSKINVKLQDNKTLQPRYSACGVVFWVPQKKYSTKK